MSSNEVKRPLTAPADRLPCLSGRGVTKVFGTGQKATLAVDHVDFDFREGEFVSIVGESGSGKTTLSKILLGLLNPRRERSAFKANRAIYPPAASARNTGAVFRPFFRILIPPTTPSTKSIPCCLTASPCAAASGCP